MDHNNQITVQRPSVTAVLHGQVVSDRPGSIIHSAIPSYPNAVRSFTNTDILLDARFRQAAALSSTSNTGRQPMQPMQPGKEEGVTIALRRQRCALELCGRC